jgi:histidine ammonia-lyase
MNPVRLNGNDLSFTDLHEVVYQRRPVLLSGEAREKVKAARVVVDALVEENKVAYAITTGVGKLSDVRIEPAQNRQLQLNLIRSHSVGVGEPLSQEETRAMMLLRANSLAKGFSGVRPEVIDLLCEMLNRSLHPVVPSQGSVGASGDLAPLAHLALVMIGEGEAILEGAHNRPGENGRMSGGDALRRAGLKPLVPEAKEAISLINGTQAMLAVGALALLTAENLAATADVLSAMSLDALHGTDVAFDERIHLARPHAGQMLVAANLRRLLSGSQIRESHKNCERVQDAYSLRCIPQVHGAVRDTLEFCRRTFEIEMNSAVDNPLVFPSGGDVLSGGNFHGQPLAFALDYLAIVLTALAGISERRIERLVNPALNEGLPPFLAVDAGMNSGFMMPQVTAAALASENKGLAHPASVDSITTSGNKEDYVSMGMSAAIKLKKVVVNTTHVLAIEACAAAQALDFLAPLETSTPLRQAYSAIRSVCGKVEHDRAMSADFARVADFIRSGGVLR